MNRQYCILVYSKNSPVCRELFRYIEALPFDLMNTTGITPCCADNKTMRNTLVKTGVEVVPTLMIKYFNNSQQQLSGDDIYDWIAEIATVMGYAGDRREESIPESTEEIDQPKSEISLLTKALSMQKSRETEMSDKNSTVR